MAIFTWQGMKNGEAQEGEIEANSISDASKDLSSQKIIITGISPKAEESSKKPEASSKKLKKYNPRKIKTRHLMIITKKLATMVEAGLPILKTLRMLEDQEENLHLKFVLNSITNQVESGTTLSDAFATHPTVFDTIYINLLKAGESSGRLTFFLHRLVIQLEKSEEIRAKVKGAMMYPLILLSVAIGVMVVMLIKVVPVFQKMFSSSGNELPGPTQLVVNISEFLRNPAGGGTLLIVIIVAFLGIRHLIKHNPAARKKFHGYLLRIPLVSAIVMKSTLARISIIEGNLSAAGVAILNALDIIHDAINNVHYKEALMNVRTGVSEGTPLSELFERTPELFPPTFTQMIAVGEETGKMDEMFESISRYYEEEFDMVVDRLTELLEPAMILFIGSSVGFLIVALYMPIFQIGQTI